MTIAPMAAPMANVRSARQSRARRAHTPTLKGALTRECLVARLAAKKTVVHAGRRTETAEGKVLDGHDKLIAHATTTCIILPAAD